MMLPALAAQTVSKHCCAHACARAPTPGAQPLRVWGGQATCQLHCLGQHSVQVPCRPLRRVSCSARQDKQHGVLPDAVWQSCSSEVTSRRAEIICIGQGCPEGCLQLILLAWRQLDSQAHHWQECLCRCSDQVVLSILRHHQRLPRRVHASGHCAWDP